MSKAKIKVGNVSVPCRAGAAPCPSRWLAYECSLPAGHEGMHSTNGGLTFWPDVADTRTTIEVSPVHQEPTMAAASGMVPGYWSKVLEPAVMPAQPRSAVSTSSDSVALRRLADLVEAGGRHAYTVEVPRLKRWDDPSVSWDARARVAARAQNADTETDSRYKWDTLSIEDQAELIAGISDLIVCPNDYHDGWVACVHDALRAEGFEV